jgi:hypothetical protein
MEDTFNIPLIDNYSERFTFIGDELDIVKMNLWDVSNLSKSFNICYN